MCLEEFPNGNELTSIQYCCTQSIQYFTADVQHRECSGDCTKVTRHPEINSASANSIKS
jgi:hypothetical protein